MDIVYETSSDAIGVNQLGGGFFEGWPNPPSPELHLKILKGSYRIALALDSETNKVVGYVTATSDGVLSSFIPFLEVLPEYREKGIATELMKRIVAQLEIYMIDLACDDDLVPFYERLGMKKANAMMLRNFDLQSG